MALEPINYGAAANDGTGDSLRDAMRKTQGNFEYLDQAKADAQATAIALQSKVTAEAGKSLMLDAEHARLATVEGPVRARMLEAVSVQDFLQQMCDLGPGYYRTLSNTPGLPPDSSGFFSIVADTYTFVGAAYQTGAPIFLSGNLASLAIGSYQRSEPVKSEVGKSLMTDAERIKLLGVAAGATANSSDGALVSRINHTGPLNWAWATYGGTANTVTLAPAFARTAYVVGDEFRFRATATNTGATTINVNGLGAKTAVTVTGAALPAGYIRTGVDTVCVYDGTNFVVQRDMERGSNANGTYVKYADGTQMCWGGVDMPNTAPHALAVWTFPSAFSTAPNCLAVPRSIVGGGGSAAAVGELNRNGLYYSASATNLQLNSYNYQTPQTNIVGLGITAQGVWY